MPDTLMSGRVFYRSGLAIFFDVLEGTRITELAIQATGTKKLILTGRFGEEPNAFIPGIAAQENQGNQWFWIASPL